MSGPRGSFRLRRSVAGVVIISSICLGAATEADATTTRVRVTDLGFRPSAIRVALGDSVRWTDIGTSAHVVMSDPAGFFRVELEPGGDGRRVMRSAGTFTYSCRLQPDMRAVVRVPVIAEPRTGATPGARITITIATARVQGRTYDVRWRRDDGRWRGLRQDVRARRAFFVPSRTGEFAFRARVHLTESGGTSRWSPRDRVLVVPAP